MNDIELDWLNRLPDDNAIELFRGCCGAEAWCRKMTQHRPYANIVELHRMADLVMDGLNEQDWRQAFECHPPIGDLDSLKMKYAGNQAWSAAEQSGMATANDELVTALALGNAQYLRRFGFLFIVCASGKSASEMLSILQKRLQSSPEVEMQNASAEQRKITHLRIDKIKNKS